MANPELGAKQVCPNCQAKFYDLTRRPAHCPKCDTEFDPEEALKNRRTIGRGRPAGYAADEDAEDQVKDKSGESDDEDEEAETSTPEIDQEGHEPIVTPDDDDDESSDDDAGMGSSDGDDDLGDDDDDDSVPFIEDEDDDSFDDEIAKPSKDDD
ncbi:TIGR02300 family protein [Brevundimonas sp. S30B]|uniref:TIGR02300 family protein n=1 Tax=unclassified Brevundimonas TaxID=2622653 RepID=UPI001072504C|nr:MULTISPECIES: TIGR02300 family protein [unclassified Brevundimonas]QBX36581.1 TIGR02300 family protein [Brevundimonas sp. MF30-B]TFW00881.1 TIGR02300 family protein [Brevundimonas sp. S30B]